jgi:anaerobic ribonucleoside-triphosphate reductase activating protein
MKLPSVELYGIGQHVTTLGPGARYVLWFQGCPFSCEGCIAPDSQPFGAGNSHTLLSLARSIGKALNIEGVTFSGGEPFAQPEALSLLAQFSQRQGLGVIAFSGFRYSALCKTAERNGAVRSALAAIDVLIDGLFEADQSDCDGMRGSENQNIHFLSERYKRDRDAFIQYDKNRSAMVFSETGTMLAGIPAPALTDVWIRMAGHNKGRQS